MNIGPIRITKKRCFLLLAGLLTLWAAWPFLPGKSMQGGYVGTLGSGILAGVKLILAGVCFAVACVEWFAFPFTRFIDGVFGLNPDQRKPPLDLTQMERFISQGMPEAVEREFRRLLEYYPQSTKIWRRYLEYLAETQDNPARQSLLEEARHHFRFDPVQLDKICAPGKKFNSLTRQA